jgi:hypothetical protein
MTGRHFNIRRHPAFCDNEAVSFRRIPPANELRSKRLRTAALQDLAEGIACDPSRQRLGVRLSSAAFVVGIDAQSFVRWPVATLYWSLGSPDVGG